MTPTENRSTNPFVNAARKVYHPLHFDKGYNFVLCKLHSQPYVQLN